MSYPADLRAAYRSLAEVEADQPGFDYDRGYLTGWHDERRHIRRPRARGLLRDPARIAEFRLGYRHGRKDGKGRETDWWPDHARGRNKRVTAEKRPRRPVSPPGGAGCEAA